MSRSAVAWSPSFVAGAAFVVTDLRPEYDHVLSLPAVICWLAGAVYRDRRTAARAAASRQRRAAHCALIMRVVRTRGG
jgi:hypothetical protein